MAREHSPGRETQPPPSHTTAGTPDRAHALNPRGSQHTATNAQRANKGEEEGGRAPSPSTPAPASPREDSPTAKATPRTADAHPRHPTITPAPERRGMPASKDTATSLQWQKQGPDPRSGEHTGAGAAAGRGRRNHGSSPSSSTRQRRQTGGSKTANGSGPWGTWKRDTPGHGPEAQQTASILRRTERGTDGVRPREANTTEWRRCSGVAARHHETHGSKQPVVGRRKVQVDHHGPPQDITTRGLPAQGQPHSTPGTMDWHPWHPHWCSRPLPHTRGAASQPGRTLPPRTGGPHAPNTHKAPHAPPHLRDATGQQRPGDNTHMRRGRVGHPRQGKGAQGGHTRGRGWQQWGGGRQAHTAGVTNAIQGPKTPRTRPGHQENQHGVPHTRAVP